jgi:hypothetical protein
LTGCYSARLEQLDHCCQITNHESLRARHKHPTTAVYRLMSVDIRHKADPLSASMTHATFVPPFVSVTYTVNVRQTPRPHTGSDYTALRPPARPPDAHLNRLDR